jgi:HK97 gp10 family phage protein
MNQDVKCEIDGLDDIEQLLEIVLPNQAKGAVRTAGRKAGKIWQDAVEETAPRDTGFLADNINISIHVGSGDSDSTGDIEVIVSPTKDAFYALFQEFGTRNQPARPFVQPAYEEKKEEVLTEFTIQLLNQLQKLAK